MHTQDLRSLQVLKAFVPNINRNVVKQQYLVTPPIRTPPEVTVRFISLRDSDSKTNNTDMRTGRNKHYTVSITLTFRRTLCIHTKKKLLALTDAYWKTLTFDSM